MLGRVCEVGPLVRIVIVVVQFVGAIVVVDGASASSANGPVLIAKLASLVRGVLPSGTSEEDHG